MNLLHAQPQRQPAAPSALRRGQGGGLSLLATLTTVVRKALPGRLAGSGGRRPPAADDEETTMHSPCL